MNILAGFGLASQAIKLWGFVTSVYAVIVEAEKAYRDKEITKEERNAVLDKIIKNKNDLALKNISDELVTKLVDVLVALANGAGVFLK